LSSNERAQLLILGSKPRALGFEQSNTIDLRQQSRKTTQVQSLRSSSGRGSAGENRAGLLGSREHTRDELIEGDAFLLSSG